VAARYPGVVRVVDASAKKGANYARNQGIAAAAGSSLILFCDVDDVVHPGWVEAYWKAYRSGARLMGGPRHRVRFPGDPQGSWQRSLANSLGFRPWPAGANCAVAVEVIERAGSFDEAYRYGGDDTDFFWRAQLAGYKLRYVPGAAIDYVERDGLRSLYRQRRAYGVSHVQLFATYGAHGMPRLRGGLVRRMLVNAVRRSIRLRSLVPIVQEVGILVGHVRGSIRFRTFYL
jgi:GT2 family glycosyltransferase